MANRSEAWLLWTPRVLGLLMCVFLGLFALDAFEAGKPLARALPDFLVHLIPSAILLGIVGIAWRQAWIGGGVFIGLALGYGYMAREHPSWIAAIAIPLLAIGALYLVSWRHHARLHRPS